MTAAERLAQIEARANAADRAGVFESDFPTWDAWEAAWDSSTDVPALVAALRAVLDLHRPTRVYAYAEDCGCGNEDHVIVEDEWGEDLCFDTPTGEVQCAYCRAEQSYVEHPCETVRAIEGALA